MNKKAIELSFNFIFSLLIAIVLVSFFAWAINLNTDCEIGKPDFKEKLIKKIDNVLHGNKKEGNYELPCNADRIYFLDLSKNRADELNPDSSTEVLDPEAFKDNPIIKNSLKSKAETNVFVMKKNKIIDSFYAGNISLIYPYNLCLQPGSGRVKFWMEGTGLSTKITPQCKQPDCNSIQIEISKAKSKKILEDAILNRISLGSSKL